MLIWFTWDGTKDLVKDVFLNVEYYSYTVRCLSHESRAPWRSPAACQWLALLDWKDACQNLTFIPLHGSEEYPFPWLASLNELLVSQEGKLKVMVLALQINISKKVWSYLSYLRLDGASCGQLSDILYIVFQNAIILVIFFTPGFLIKKWKISEFSRSLNVETRDTGMKILPIVYSLRPKECRDSLRVHECPSCRATLGKVDARTRDLISKSIQFSGFYRHENVWDT